MYINAEYDKLERDLIKLSNINYECFQRPDLLFSIESLFEKVYRFSNDYYEERKKVIELAIKKCISNELLENMGINIHDKSTKYTDLFDYLDNNPYTKYENLEDSDLVRLAFFLQSEVKKFVLLYEKENQKLRKLIRLRKGA